MNLFLVHGLEEPLMIAVLPAAVILTAVLLLIKILTLFWLNDPVLFGNSVQNVEVDIPKINMSKINVPFTFKLQDENVSSYEGVHCITSSEVCYRLEAFWGVSISNLHYFLRQPWDLDGITSLKDSALDGHFQYCADVIRNDSHEVESIKLELLNDTVKLSLGVPPRQYYPLVVFLMRDCAEDTLLPDETVALVNVIHIKDNVCTLPTCLLAQYLKQANGRLTTLKQLYIASENSANCEESDDNPVKNDNSDPLCIVCQVYPISRALLPCRHTCICASCFGKINACPLCRSPIKSYFLVETEEYYVEPNECHCSYDGETFSHWFHDRVADFLGFDR